jgi:hypothetical protein
MFQGDRKLRGTEERSASKLSITLELKDSLKLTIPGNEVRCCPTPAADAGVVILIGSSTRQEG